MKAGGYTLHSSQFFPFSHLFPFKHSSQFHFSPSFHLFPFKHSSLFHFSPFSHLFPFKQQESHLSLFLKPTASHFQFPPQPPLSRSPPSQISQISQNFPPLSPFSQISQISQNFSPISPPSQISQISRNFSHSFFPFVYYISIVMGK